MRGGREPLHAACGALPGAPSVYTHLRSSLDAHTGKIIACLHAAMMLRLTAMTSNVGWPAMFRSATSNVASPAHQGALRVTHACAARWKRMLAYAGMTIERSNAAIMLRLTATLQHCWPRNVSRPLVMQGAARTFSPRDTSGNGPPCTSPSSHSSGTPASAAPPQAPEGTRCLRGAQMSGPMNPVDGGMRLASPAGLRVACPVRP